MSRDAASSRPIVLGYYWNKEMPVDRINFSQFTHICHAFVVPATSGTLKMAGSTPSRELCELAHKAGVKVLLSLGGADSGEAFAAIVRDVASEKAFVENVVRVIRENGYDGVDIDWEFPKDEIEKQGCTRLARQFSEELKKEDPDALVTAAFSGSAWASRWLDSESLLRYLDFINVMTYDMHGPWGGHAGPNSALETDASDSTECQKTSVKGMMAHWTVENKWPASRLLVGVPCYGRGFVVDKWYDPLPKGVKAPHTYIPYNEVGQLIADGWQRHWNQATSTPWLSKVGVKELLSYDDQESARMKGKWAAENGFPGVFFWEITQDFSGGSHVIVKSTTEGYESAKK